MALTTQLLQERKQTYMVQLDALRALAVLGVLVYHFLPHDFWLNKYNIGQHGVRCFFVLSGFLITGILLQNREKIDSKSKSFWSTIQTFYKRRLLRICPAYYTNLVLTSLIAFPVIKHSLLYHLTYISDIYYGFVGKYDLLTSHFWSLAVEFQFYLIWPWLILLSPKKNLVKIITLTILISPLYRLVSVLTDLSNGIQEYTVTVGCLDALGLGALLALFNYYEEEFKQIKIYLCNFGFWVCGLLFVTDFLPIKPLYTAAPKIYITGMIVWVPTLVCIFFVWLIDRASQRFSGELGTFLELKPLLYLGKISYGIYLYHLIVAYMLFKVFNYLGMEYPSSTATQFFLQTGATIMVASLSWHLIEKPLNKLKHKL